MKRGLTPSSQADRHRPEPVHVAAQRAPRLDASPPPRRISNTSVTIAVGSRVSMPAGPAVGQTSTHFPQRVQRSRMSLILTSSAATKASARSVICSSFNLHVTASNNYRRSTKQTEIYSGTYCSVNLTYERRCLNQSDLSPATLNKNFCFMRP